MSYVKSLTDALNSVQCEVDTGYARIDRGVDAAATLIKASQDEGGSVWLCGNGGSGTIADHIACDMVKMRGWRAFALTNPALTTTMANDIEYGRAFAAQLEVLSRSGDVVIGMSCSGMSQNVCNAMGFQAHPRLRRIILTGFEANNILRALMPNVGFYVPSSKYGEVQIAHLMILHAIIDLADGAP
jgi:phosphoheptose isomerase